MRDASDTELLREYARQDSEAAFAELVRRHVNLVYSAALRHVGIAAQAEEITQAVFVILARKAASLRADLILDAWLFETTRLTALSFLRGERRRQFREQEAYMQSILQESTPDPVWQQLAPLLDEAMMRLGRHEREAVVLRFFKDRSLGEVAAVLNIKEPAAQKRVDRALEKLHRYFNQRGISSTTAIIAGAISANSVQLAPVTLAKAVTAAAVVKGAATPISTLTLIKGALKIMAWTKAKTAIIVGAGVLLAAGTTTVTVKEIQEHRNYPWQGKEGNINTSQLDQPPQVRIVSSRFHEPDIYTADKLLGTGVRAQDVVANAYGFITPVEAIFNVQLPAGRYDYIACLPGGKEVNEQALQAEVRRQFGVIGKIETRDTDVWLLKVKYPNTPGLKRNDKDQGNGLFTTPNGFRGWHEAMSNLAYALEDKTGVPVLDRTGLTDRFDFDLNCTESDLKNHDWDAVNQALNQLGLELVSANVPIEMLVVEKAK